MLKNPDNQINRTETGKKNAERHTLQIDTLEAYTSVFSQERGDDAGY